MCGILFYHSFSRPVDQDKFQQALNALAHRGPDGEGVWISSDEKVALGHRRLSINGGSLGAQPLFAEDLQGNRWGIVVNGEVYNDPGQLLKNQIELTSESDSEVLLRYLMEKHEHGINEIDGEFAFAAWNERKKCALLSRDPHGVKPLFYYRTAEFFLAASEIKALLAYGIPPQWNTNYFQEAAYFIQSGTSTFIKNVESLPAGHYLKISESIIGEPIPYATPSPLLPSKYVPKEISWDKAQDQFEELFLAAIQKRMTHNWPMSTYLSSGIDSTIITAIASKLDPTVTAYSLGFEDPQIDESHIASSWTKQHGIAHEIIQVSDQLLADHFVPAVLSSEMAVPNVNIAAKHALSERLAVDRKKIALTGEGADESLLGYYHFKQDQLQAYDDWSRMPVALQPALQDIFLKLGYVPAQVMHAASQGYQLEQLVDRPEKLHSSFLSTFLVQGTSRLNISQQWHYLTNFQTYNLGALADRTEMAHGVEGRPPFLDRALVDFIHQLPASYKLDPHSDKKILRAVARRYIPNYQVMIPKRPFVAPPSIVYSSGPLFDLFHYYLEGLYHLPDRYSKEKVKKLYSYTKSLSPREQMKFDPIWVHLVSIMILQEKFGLLYYS
ncbi:MAG TPA: asparagine synthase (glutamine-hydrolyzing) [Cytophagales bacterium]|nr:asparagine synthase (glutamine-hydrolyzing) [Cytophagales bacterium]HAA23857.1 asparagine synthase (glutamine-hydrolyzing) [Cytophagales bacterium]